MPGPSSSQEIDLELIALPLPDGPPVALMRRVEDGIHQEVNDAFAAAPHLGAETGGILLGKRDGDRIIIEDFEPVPCEHRYGPSYRLSTDDREMLRETLEWFRSNSETGLSVLGFYRSHTTGDLEVSPADEDLMHTHFAPDEDVVLLIKPSLLGSSPEDFAVRRYRPAAEVDPPSNGWHPGPQAAADVPLANRSAPLAWPPPRPRLLPEPERSIGRRRFWGLAALGLGLLGGALGYWWLHQPATPHMPAAKPAPVPASEPPAPATAPAVEGAPAAGPDLAGIHGLLDRWSNALKQGEVNRAAECYAPRVTTYYKQHEVSREAVRQSLQQARARYGRLDIYRISGLGITPVSDERAIVTFRKYWRTAGRGRSSGEEEERMTLVRNQGMWQISSEQAER